MVVLIPGNSGHPGIKHSIGLRSVSFSLCIGISVCVCACETAPREIEITKTDMKIFS